MRALPFLLTGALVSGAMVVSPALAQPAPAADMARAKELYVAAEQAMKDQRYSDAVRDYGSTYDITRDPVLFFKIASASERNGNCNVALIYYGRYVKEARPSEAHVELTRERIVACGGDPRNATPTGGTASTSVTATGAGATATGTAGTAGSGSTVPAGSTGGTTAGATVTAGSAARPAGSTDGATATTGTTPDAATGGNGAGSTAAGATITGAPDAPSPPSVVTMRPRNKGAWLLVTSSIAFVTIGSVLAYSADSAEADIEDLYQGFGGQPARFDAKTLATYDDLVDEGRRYEKLSWVSFGLAGITAVGAAVLFATGPDEKTVRVTPTVTPTGGSVSATLRW